MRSLLISPLVALALSGLVAAAIASTQAFILNACDSKLGCHGGIEFITVISGIAAGLVQLLVVCVWAAALLFMRQDVSKANAYWSALCVAVMAALMFTSSGWISGA